MNEYERTDKLIWQWKNGQLPDDVTVHQMHNVPDWLPRKPDPTPEQAQAMYLREEEVELSWHYQIMAYAGSTKDGKNLMIKEGLPPE